MKEYKEEDYRTIFSVEKTFEQMAIIVEKQYKIDHLSGGRKDGATPQERLEITYCRQYVSQRYLASEYNIGKSRIAPIIKWVIKILVQDSSFSLPNRLQNIYDNSGNRAIDVTETKIDRPTKHQKNIIQVRRKSIVLKLK